MSDTVPTDEQCKAIAEKSFEDLGYASTHTLIRAGAAWAQEAAQPVALLSDTCCGSCDYDEAEGGLFRHCNKCMEKIVSELWCREHAAPPAAPDRSEK